VAARGEEATQVSDESVDVLMITHRRPEYVELALPRLLDSADDATRVWLWHNGDDERTRAVVERHTSHPAVHQYHWSLENVGIRTPTNWMFESAAGAFVSKVDDDCLVAEDWLARLRHVHRAAVDTGVVGSWRFYDEDFDPVRAMRKVERLGPGARLMRNHWVQGSGYLARRRLVEQQGAIRDGETFNDWCIRAALAGARNGWAFPFVPEEHMDDPRSPHTLFTDDERFLALRPLSAKQTGVDSVAKWQAQMRTSARTVQAASLDPRLYRGPGLKARNASRRVIRALMGRTFF
jgi:Glycosyl transferase family 2